MILPKKHLTKNAKENNINKSSQSKSDVIAIILSSDAHLIYEARQTYSNQNEKGKGKRF